MGLTSEAFRHAAEVILPSVVTIHVKVPVARNDEDKPTEIIDEDADPRGHAPTLFARPEQHGPENTTGSGVIIDSAGVILTNRHVVKAGGVITVRLNDGREFEGTAVKMDPCTDVAILRIRTASHLQAAELGDSDVMRIGDWVLAVGSPFGLSGLSAR